MSAATSIEWTDCTWNPVTGCQKVSPGCKHCYAETVANRFWATQYPEVPVSTREDLDATNTLHRPRRFTDVMCHEDRLLEPLSWRKPQRVFVNSMSDLFHEDVPDAFIDQVFAVMALAPQHTFQVLTKRPARMLAYMSSAELRARVREAGERIKPSSPPRHWYHVSDWSCRMATWPLRNVWLGESVEDPQRADERIPLLLQTPAAVQFVSAEPLLGPVNVREYVFGECRDCGTARAACDGLRSRGQACCPDCRHRRLSWVIVGGESGHGARPCAIEWVERVVAQCQAASVPVFVKQLGAYVVSDARTAPAAMMSDPGEALRCHAAPDGEVWAWRAGLTDRKGGDPSEWPEDLRVREFPE